VAFHELSTGASNDIKQATGLARAMVTQYGMSSKVGGVNHDGGQEVFVGRDWGKEREHSEKTAEVIDIEIRRLVDEAEKKALALLKKNRKVLDKLSAILLEREVVEGWELDELLGIKPAKKSAPSAPPKAGGNGPRPTASAPVIAPSPA
jgi:cell division protease FtsH